ncbi:O-antigen ligase family protein [Geodermatophilus sp. SYSU D00867]
MTAVVPAPVRPDHRPPAVPPRTRSRSLVTLAALLVVVGSVGWRRGEYFTGSLDPVVVAKACVSVLALALAFLLAQAGPRRRVGTGTVWWLGLLLACTVLGALTAGHLVAGGVVAVRVALLGATVLLLLRAVSAVDVLTAVVRACVAVALVAAVTGLPSYTDGRLAGGVPAIDPNELALLASTGVLYVAWRTVVGRAGVRAALTAAVLSGVVWATGSRTALLMLVLGVAAMALHIRRPRVGLVVGGLVLAGAAAVTVVSTGAVAGFVSRGGDGTSTLGSRFIAWRAALDWADSQWQTAVGGGLSVKIIRVQGQYWDTQPLDSSWVSLLVQAGWVGVLLGGGWVLWSLRGVLEAPRAHRVLFLGLLVFLLGRSVLESGLFDASVAFLLFTAVSLLAEGGSRDRLRAEESEVPA